MDRVFLVVAYDIPSNRRRNRLAKALKDYGHRVNYSVFECEFKRNALPELKKRVSGIINKKKDSVLYYELCHGCQEKRESVGLRKIAEQEHIIKI